MIYPAHILAGFPASPARRPVRSRSRGHSLTAASLRLLVATIAAALSIFVSPSMVAAEKYSPKSPQVRSMVSKAMGYIDTNLNGESRIGGHCLLGLTAYKAGRAASDPLIVKGIRSAKALADTGVDEVAKHKELYSVGLACIFLCEIDAAKYQPEIKTLLRGLEQAQKDGGGWGYPFGLNAKSSDTSMTQYAVLAFWYADQNGIPVNKDSVRRVAEWLVRTQDPSGGWGYQGNDPGEDSRTRVKQTSIRVSLTAGAVGSLYACGEILKILEKLQYVDAKNSELPEALKLVRSAAGSKSAANLDRSFLSRLRRATYDGDYYIKGNLKYPPGQYPFYTLYSLERCKTFRSLYEKSPDPSPEWYDGGVEWLIKQQESNGSFRGVNGETGNLPSAAFATLFLMRSMQKSIQREFGSGQLAGGRGLPSDTRNIRIRGGQIQPQAITVSAADLLAAIEQGESIDTEAFLAQPSIEDVLGNDQLRRFRHLATQSELPEQRLLAVSALGVKRDLDNVMTFIAALNDKDLRVTQAARDALRFTSRKLSGFGLPDLPSEAEVKDAVTEWEEWYRAIRPSATDGGE